MKYFIYIGGIAGVLLIVYSVLTYNKLVLLGNKVKYQRSQIDIELKRRFDLIPNLVEVVKGYAKHESDTLEDVVKARNTYFSASGIEAQLKADGLLDKALSRLFVLTESYPDLKADKSFLDLQKTLAEIESKILFARHFCNNAIYKYDTKIEVFPSRLVAKLGGFTKETYFVASEEEKASIKVDFK